MGRANPGDQFTLSLDMMQGTNWVSVAENVTTEGADLGVQEQIVGPLATSRARTFKFTEAAATGTDMVNYDTTYECLVDGEVMDPEVKGTSTTGTVAFPATGESVVCTFTNIPKIGPWTLQKSANPASGSVVTPGQEITYSITASNASDVTIPSQEVVDDLSGVLNNATLVAGSISPAGQGVFDEDAQKITWTVPALARTGQPGSTATLTYKVRVNDDAFGVELRNVVTPPVTYPPEPCAEEDPDCLETEHLTGVPTITKTGVSAIKQGSPDQFIYDVTYRVEVANDNDFEVDYTLTDTPQEEDFWALDNSCGADGSAPGTGSNQCKWVAEAVSPTPAADMVSPIQTDGSWTIAKGKLPAGSTYAFLVKARIVIDQTQPNQDPAPECSDMPGDGGRIIINNATVSSGPSYTDEDEGCVRVTGQDLDITKTVTGTSFDGDEWTVGYRVRVERPENQNGHHTLIRYNLEDVLHYGEIDVESGAWTLSGEPEGSTMTPDSGTFTDDSGVWSATLATNRAIGGSGNAYVHNYDVTVKAKVPAEVWGDDEALECSAEEGSESGGFLNKATLTTIDGVEKEVEACSTPATPTVEKTGTSNTLGADGKTWTLKYDVTVKNTADSDMPFTLTDTPISDDDLAAKGLERTSAWTATALEGASVVTNASFTTGSDPWVIVDEGEIPAKPVDADATYMSYEVSVDVQVKAGDVVDPGAVCTDTETEGIVVPNVASLSSGNHRTEDDGCTAVETTTLEIDKTFQSATQRPDGTWDVEYLIEVSNVGEISTAYDLSDQIRFDQSQIKVLDGEWTGPGSASGAIGENATEVTLATAAVIPGGSIDSYAVKVHAEVQQEAWSTPGALQCSTEAGEGSSGFLNSATVTWPGGEAEAEDCGDLEKPSIVKGFLSANPDEGDPNKWTVQYFVYVLGAPNTSFNVDVYDQPGYPEGVSLLKGEWDFPYNPSGTPAPSESGIIATEGDNAWVIKKGVQIPEGGMLRYLVSWDVEIADTVAPEFAECEEETGAGYGFFNEARLVNSGNTQEDTACGPITAMVNPSVEKSVSGVSQGVDGSWTVVYDVVVSLPTGELNPEELSAKYDLVDTLDFGDGLTPTSASWKQVLPEPVSEVTEFDSQWSTLLAADKVITPEAPVHRYEVTVVADVGNDAFDGGTATCVVGEEGPESSGFLNRAVLTTVGGEQEVTACGGPAAPVVSKDALPVVDNGDGTWTVSYKVAVANPTSGDDAQSLAYVLTDQPQDLPAGVELVDGWKAAAGEGVPGDAGLPTNPLRPQSGEWIVAQGTIPAESTYAFTISADVKLDVASLEIDPGATCEGSQAVGIPLSNAAGVVSGEFEAEDEACTTIPLPDLDVEKVWKSSTQTTVDGQWKVVYDVVVTNDSEVGTVYDLSDDIRFDGVNVKVDSASWTGQSEGVFADGETSASLASNEYLEAGGSHQYTVTVTASVVAGAWNTPGSLQCAAPGQDGNGGFLNEVTVTFPGGEATDEACDTPVRPTVAKDGVSATQSDVDPNNWSVAYTITVQGAALGADTLYDLADVPAFAEGVSVQGGIASLRGGGSDYQNLPIVAAGGPIATDVELPAGTNHVWDVVWSVVIDTPIVGEGAECTPDGEPGSGFFNTAVLSTGGTSQDDDACLPIASLVRPSVEKSVSGVSQGVDGSWTVVYDVVVSLPVGELNPDGLSAKYDLVDTLDFGEGLTPVSASWRQVLPLPVSGVSDFDSQWSTVLAADRVITPEAPVHRYEVTVVANAGNEAFENGTAQCVAPGASEEGSGFLNRAILSSGGSDSEAEDCASPGAPSATKTGYGSPVQNLDGTWTVQYLATVTNPTETLDLAYEVTDIPSLPKGVALATGTTWTAAAHGTTPADQVATPSWDGTEETGPWVFAKGMIPAGETYQFLISATLSIDIDEVVELDDPCGVGTVGIPLHNELGMISGEFESDDESCVAVPAPATWTLQKSSNPESGSEVQPGAKVRYTLTVTNTSEEVELFDAVVLDDLSDVLKHATLKDSSLPEGVTVEGETLTWLVEPVKPGEKASISYTVTVNKDAFNVKFKNVATPGSTGGSCVPGECTTNHITPGEPGAPTLPKTGAAVGGILVLGAGLLGAGYLLTRRSRGRTSGRHSA